MTFVDSYTPPKVIQPDPKKRQAMYIWLDGLRPTAKMRSKTKILAGDEVPLIWGFDGSSTEQAEGHNSDCILVPVFSCKDTVLGGDNLLVLCEVFLPNGEPHPSNTRAKLREAAARYADHEPLFGLEQEYTFLDGNLPFAWPTKGAPAPQGGYYCGVGSDEALGRHVVEDHLEACLNAER